MNFAPKLPRPATRPVLLLFLALAALLAYAPSLTIPLIADDYPNLTQAQTYGAPTGLPVLLEDAQFRLRATSYWTMFALWRLARLTPAVYHAASLLLHIANTWLVFFAGALWPRMRAGAFWAALMFAVQEGHQEAVMWFSAINELLMFFFGMASLVCWLKAENAKPAWRQKLAGLKLAGLKLAGLELAGAALFAFALLSKESAVCLLPLFLLATPHSDWRRSLLRLLPHAALGTAALVSIVISRSNSFRFSDGSFSLGAPFWITLPHSIGRILWIWGWAAVIAVLISRDRRLRGSALLALGWIGIALGPYAFLTYSTGIPSRQTYLASAGLAFLFGATLAHLAGERPRRARIVTAVVTLMLAHNVAYLWTKKRSQFLERAAPTEQLIAFARQTPGPIWVRCFPQPALVAEEAVHLAAGRSPSSLVWNAAAAAQNRATEFCFRAR